MSENIALAAAQSAAASASSAATSAEYAATIIAEPNDAAVSTLVNTPASSTAAALAATTVTREQDGDNVDDPQRWYMGEKVPGVAPKGVLYLEYHGGWLAQRVSIGGIWDEDIRTAPSLEIFPAASFYRPDLVENDNENSISPLTCFQLYRYGHGDCADREYFYVEAHNDHKSTVSTGVGAKYEIGVWASGTGAVRPITWRAGNIESFTVTSGGEIQIDRRITTDATNNIWPKIRLQQDTANTQLELRTASENTSGSKMFLSKARGTVAAPTPPLAFDTLADIQVGTITGAGEHIGGAFRMVASENWVVGSAHGTRARIQVTAGGTTGTVTGLEVGNPSTSLDTSATLLVNLAGTVSSKKVLVGAADSGGVGYRMLRVAN